MFPEHEYKPTPHFSCCLFTITEGGKNFCHDSSAGIDPFLTKKTKQSVETNHVNYMTRTFKTLDKLMNNIANCSQVCNFQFVRLSGVDFDVTNIVLLSQTMKVLMPHFTGPYSSGKYLMC